MPVGPVMVAGLLPDSHPVKASAQAFAAKYEAVHGAGSVSLFAAYTWDVALLLQQAVPVALKAARPGTPEFRAALRDALENVKNLPTATGVVNMSPADHNGGRARPGHGDGCGRQVARAVEEGGLPAISRRADSRASRALACPPCARKRSRFCMLSVLPDKHSGGRGMTGYNRAVAGTGRFRRWLAGGLLALAGGAACAQVPGLPPAVVKAWKETKLPDSALSLVVQEVGGPRLVALNAKEPRNPASVMKLVTTWAALSELGPNYVWRTEFMTEPGARPDAKGALSGPLYLRAGGDPQFLMQDLWVLLRELRLRGVKQINDLVIDRSIFGQVGTDPGAFDGAPDRAYNASPDALMVGFGAVRLMFLPDAAAHKWVPLIDPPLPGLKIEGKVEWTEARCPGAPVVSTEPLITQQGVTLRVSGKVAGSCGEFSLYRLALSQPDYATEVFRMLWRELGGTFKGQVRTGMVPGDAVVLASHDSPTLAEVIRQINKRSNNVMARTLLLTLGAERGRKPATVASSEAVAKSLLARQGLDMPELVIDNGAGLSREARVSADSLASMLTVAWNSPVMPEYISSLAIAGVDGTVRRRLKGDGTQGMAHLKTGSLRDVRSIAGYVLGASGKRYVLVSMVNHEQAGAVRAFDDALIAWLAEQ